MPPRPSPSTSDSDQDVAATELIARLILGLRSSGFTADMRQAIAVQSLLSALGPVWLDPEFDRAAHLGPIFCRGAEEQHRFRRIVEDLGLCEAAPLSPGRAHAVSDTTSEAPDSEVATGIVISRPQWSLREVVAWGILAFAIAMAWSLAPGFARVVDLSPPPPKVTPPIILPEVVAPAVADQAPAKLLSYHRVMHRQPVFTVSRWSWFYASVPLLIFGGWYLWRRGQRPRLRRESTDLPQLFRKVSLPGGPREPLSRLRVREVARSLRQRQRVASRELNVDSTIARTVERGGIPTPVFDSLIETRYLVLIDQMGNRDHFGELASLLANTLETAGVDLRTFEYYGNPTFCNHPPKRRRKTEPFRFSLSKILDDNPDRPLLILGDGARFINPVTGQLPEWFSLVRDRSRFLVTPAEGERDWTPLERQLRSEGFQVIPMTPVGIPEIAAVLSGMDSPRRNAQRYPLMFESEPDRCLSPFEPDPDTVQRLLQELKVHLGPEGFLWLVALAAYPEVHWGLSLRFGASLIPNEQAWEQLLPRMTRLIWLRRGYMPDWLREALLKSVPRDQEARIRSLLLEFLATAEIQKTLSEGESASAQELPLRIVVEPPVHWWQRIARWWRTRQQVKQLTHIGWIEWAQNCWKKWTHGTEPPKSGKYDYVFLRHITGRTWLDAVVPEKWIGQLSARDYFSFGAFVLLAVSSLLGGMFFAGSEFSHRRPIPVVEMEVSSGGETVVTRDSRGVSRGWRASPVTALELQGHTDFVTSVAFSRDGQQIVTGSGDQTARVWDARTGQSLRELQGHTNSVSSVAFSPDGQQIVTGSTDKTARVWDLHTENYDWSTTSGEEWIGMSSAGHRWAIRERSGGVTVHEVAQPKPIFQLEAAQSGTVVLLSDDGTQLAVGRPNEVMFHSLDRPHDPPIPIRTSLATPVSGILGYMSRLVLWDDTGHAAYVSQQLGEVPIPIPSKIVGHSLSRDQRTLSLWNQAGKVVVLNLEGQTPPTEMQLAGTGLPRVAFGPKSDLGIAWNESGHGEIFWPRGFLGKSDFTSSKFSAGQTILSAGFSESGKSLYLLGADHKLTFERVFEPGNKEELSPPDSKSGLQSAHTTVENVKLVAQGGDNTLAVVFQDGSVRLYDAEFGVPVSDPLPTSGPVALAAFGRPEPVKLKEGPGPAPPVPAAAALFQVPVALAQNKGKEPPPYKDDPKQSVPQNIKAQDALPEPPNFKGNAAEPFVLPATKAPATRQSLALTTESGNIELWELNNSGRAVALLISGDTRPVLEMSKEIVNLSELLQSRYGFEVVQLIAPTKADVDMEWNRLKMSLSPSDRFMFVYTGKAGIIDGSFQFQLSQNQRIANSEVQKFLRDIQATQVLLIADCSFAGALIESPSNPISVNGTTQCRLVLAGAEATKQSWRRYDGSEQKLLTPIRQYLQGAPLFAGISGINSSKSGPVISEDLFQAVNDSNEKQNAIGWIKGKMIYGEKLDTPIQFGPLAGSHHTPGARFYFPAPSPLPLHRTRSRHLPPRAEQAAPPVDETPISEEPSKK